MNRQKGDKTIYCEYFSKKKKKNGQNEQAIRFFKTESSSYSFKLTLDIRYVLCSSSSTYSPALLRHKIDGI